jgi:hypothetical protein
MPNERISMSKLKQLIELQSSNLSVRALARLTFRGSRDAFPGNFRRRQGGRDARGATWAL